MEVGKYKISEQYLQIYASQAKKTTGTWGLNTTRVNLPFTIHVSLLEACKNLEFSNVFHMYYFGQYPTLDLIF